MPNASTYVQIQHFTDEGMFDMEAEQEQPRVALQYLKMIGQIEKTTSRRGPLQ